MKAVLDQGLTTLSQNQKVTFRKYVRLVLPLDGFVFWVNASLVSQQALYNATLFNTTAYNATEGAAPTGELEVTVEGSLHHNATNQQLEQESFSINRVVFTTLNEIQDLNAVTSNVIYIGEFDFQAEPEWLTENPSARRIRFAFSNQGYFYKAAGLFHYQGDAIYPVMETQIIDSLAGFDGRSLVVSNSLPAWLSLGGNPPVWATPRTLFPLFPSYAVPDNLLPPYASVHIDPDQTQAIGSAPVIGQDSSHTQLAQDTVRITLYGLRNDDALDFMDAVNDFSVNAGLIGIMNVPTIRDQKRTQVELGILAIEKTAEFQVSYYQSRVNQYARQIIKEAVPSILFPT
jgi:hypothetical protein